MKDALNDYHFNLTSVPDNVWKNYENMMMKSMPEQIALRNSKDHLRKMWKHRPDYVKRSGVAKFEKAERRATKKEKVPDVKRKRKNKWAEPESAGIPEPIVPQSVSGEEIRDGFGEIINPEE